MFDGGITGFRIKDQSMRRLTGDELPRGPMPDMNGQFVVRADDIPSCCMECSYGGNTFRETAPDAKVVCGHPDAPVAMRMIQPQFAKSMRQPWCPLTCGSMDS